MTEIPHKTLSSKNSTNPSPLHPRAGKVKKALFLATVTGGAVAALVIPLFVSANFISDLLQKTASPSVAANALFNSQTLPLLAAAINVDPSPTVLGDIQLVNGDALVSTENPSSNDDAQSIPLSSQISVYLVRPGDTLLSIATMFHVSVNTIIGANDILKGVVTPGQELVILPITGVQHTILKGETLRGLAKAYHSDAHDIATYNNLADTDSLTLGQRIIIPNGELPTPAPSTPVKHKVKTKITKNKGFKGAPLRNAGGPEYDGYYVWPVAGGIITQSLHGFNGVDIGAPTGTDMYASAAGTVLIAKSNDGWNGGYGNYIVIVHDNGTQTLYAHASKVFVSAGDTVSSGQLIGKVGRTGESTGSHLHFEVRGATNPFGAILVGQGE